MIMSAPGTPVMDRRPLGFLDLPLEIQLVVYRESLTSRDPTSMIRATAKEPLKSHTALLCTNKLISQEATPIFYANNPFRVPVEYPLIRTTLHTRIAAL